MREELGNAQQMAEMGKSHSPNLTYGLIVFLSDREYKIEVKTMPNQWHKPLESLEKEVEVGDIVEVCFFNNYTEIREDNTGTTYTSAIVVR